MFETRSATSRRPQLAGIAMVCLLRWAETTAAEATAGDLLQSRGIVQLGAFLVDTDTRLRLDAASGRAGSGLDLRRDLGLGDADRFRADASWRFTPRHGLRAMYFNTDRSATRILERDITVEETVYPASARADSRFRTSVVQLAYEYEFWRRPAYELSATLGVHAVRIAFAIEGTGQLGTALVAGRRESAETRAPLPVVGLNARIKVMPNWYLETQGQYFSLSSGGYDGSLTDLRVDVTRMFGAHFGAGIGWNGFRTRVDIDRNSWDGSVRWRYSGLRLFVTMAL